MKIGGIDVKDLRVGVGGSAVTPSRVMVGTGSAAVKVWPLVEVHEVSVSGVRTVRLVTVSVPAGETWTVTIQGTVTQVGFFADPRFRIGSKTSGTYTQGATVNFTGTVTSSASEISMISEPPEGASFVGTVTIQK